MPEEVFVISLLAIVSGTFLTIFAITSVRKYLESRHASKAVSSSSLTTSELTGLMSRAVQDAVAPINDRLAALESSITGTPATPEEDILGDMDSYDPNFESTSTRRSRFRSSE